MNKGAIIFPGQGSQFTGMGKTLFDNSEKIKKLFGKADGVLDEKISGICFNGPEEKLRDTLFQQVAIYIVSVAAWEFLRDTKNLQPSFFAGLSLGEYTAVHASGMLSFEDTLLLVKSRGAFMEQAAKENPSTMLAALGVKAEDLKDSMPSGSYIANLNSPGQIVVSVSKEKKQEAIDYLKGKGAKKVVELKVSGGFHSPFMKFAEDKLREKISGLEFNEPRKPIVSNVDAKPHTDIEEIKENLVKQLISSVLWQSSVEFMSAQGVNLFYEVGPSKVLKGLLRKINSSLKVLNYGEISDFKDN